MMKDTLKRLACRPWAPIGLVFIAAVLLYVLDFGSEDSGVMFLAAAAVALLGGMFEVGFGVPPRKRPNLRSL
jgi:hypothetical protein